MIFLKGLLFLVPGIFLFASRDWGAAAPGFTAAAALFLWSMKNTQDDAPRLVAWAATALGCAVAMMKGSALLLPALTVFGVFLALELLSKKRNEEEPRTLDVMAALLIAAGSGWFFAQAGSPGKGLGGPIPQNIVAIGDSLTAGVGQGVDKLWTDRLEERLGGSTVIVNRSYPGDTLMESFNRWESNIQSGRWHPTDDQWKPELFIVVLGGNDIRRRVGKDALERDLRKWADALRPSGAQVLLVSVPGGLISDSYADSWRNVAKEFNYEWMTDATLRKVFTTPAMTLDGIHMNDRGMQFFADAVHERITGRP